MNRDFKGDLNWIWKGFLLGFRRRYNLSFEELDELVLMVKESLERERNIKYFGV